MALTDNCNKKLKQVKQPDNSSKLFVKRILAITSINQLVVGLACMDKNKNENHQYTDYLIINNTMLSDLAVDAINSACKSFQTHCQQFYNNFYDESKYVDSLNISVGSSSSGGCFVATATMGSYINPIVLQLRSFRDTYLVKRNWGRNFIHFYYKWGPYPANLIKKNCLIVVYKMGEYGSITFTKNNSFKTGIFPVNALKPTGAGDAFMGAFINGIKLGKSVEESVKIGTASAAIVVTRVGCSVAMPNYEELIEFIESNSIINTNEVLNNAYSSI